jgi:hypothetical protein
LRDFNEGIQVTQQISKFINGSPAMGDARAEFLRQYARGPGGDFRFATVLSEPYCRRASISERFTGLIKRFAFGSDGLVVEGHVIGIQTLYIVVSA